jgi:hypothetical protein
MKNLKFLIFLIINLFILPIFSIPNTSKDENGCCINQKDDYAFSYTYLPDIECPKKMQVSADFLWFNPIIDVVYAMSNDQNVVSSNKRSWRPGFRIGWDLYGFKDEFLFELNWMFNDIKFESSKKASNLISIYLPLNAFTIPDASYRLSGKNNVLDLSLSKPYHISRYVVGKPTFGLRAMFLDLDALFRYSIFQRKTTAKLKNNYWGVGLRAGYSAKCDLAKSFNLFANAFYSILYGKFDLSGLGSSNVSALNYKYETEFYSVKPNMELSLGVNYSKKIFKDKYLWNVNLAYEFHQYFDLIQFKRFMGSNPSAIKTNSNKDISFNGISFGMGLDF